MRRVGVVAAVAGMSAQRAAGRVAGMDRTDVKPRRLRHRGGEPEAPNRDQGTKPDGSAHNPTIHRAIGRFARSIGVG